MLHNDILTQPYPQLIDYLHIIVTVPKLLICIFNFNDKTQITFNTQNVFRDQSGTPHNMISHCRLANSCIQDKFASARCKWEFQAYKSPTLMRQTNCQTAYVNATGKVEQETATLNLKTVCDLSQILLRIEFTQITKCFTFNELYWDDGHVKILQFKVCSHKTWAYSKTALSYLTTV
jgi:hypothetical protein